MAKCPNCGKNEARKNGVLCEECVRTCPMGPEVAHEMEELFSGLKKFIKMPPDGSSPFDKDWE